MPRFFTLSPTSPLADRPTEQCQSADLPASWGEKAAWWWFLATTLQVTFLQPYVVIWHERVNLFSAGWCLVALILALAFSPRRALLVRSRVGLIALVLVGLAALSSLLSRAPAMSAARAGVILAAGLGGFGCARLLLASPARQIVWVWFCFALCLTVGLLGFWGYVWWGNIFQAIEVHFHPMAGRLILLSFAPLALLYGASRGRQALALASLAAVYTLLLLAHTSSTKGTAVLIPAAMCLGAACFHRWPKKQFIVIVALVGLTSLTAGGKIFALSHYKNRYHDSVSYRIENYAFSWHLARQHPFFGIGLWAPRDTFLEDYELTYPYLSKEDFTQWTRTLKTSENNYLTFLADLGIPFVLLYGGALGVIVIRLARQAIQPAPGIIIPPLALLVPIGGEMLHFVFYEGLFHPQVSWLFHILLGLAPLGAPGTRISREALTAFLGRSAVVLLAVGGGVGLGIGIASALGLTTMP